MPGAEGGDGGGVRKTLSAEHRKAISAALKGRRKPKGFMGDVHKAKIKASQSNRKKPRDFMDRDHREKISAAMKASWLKRKKQRESQAAEAAAAAEKSADPPSVGQGEEGRGARAP